MKEILLFGAGKSATVLIDYLLGQAAVEQWRLTLVDADLALATAKLGESPYGEAQSFDISLPEKRSAAVRKADLVISMLPPTLHRLVAASCLEHRKHLLTASYVDDHMRSLEHELLKNDVLFLCEMGLDPGIDHMSAMKLIDEIRAQGGIISAFASHCGGLIAPESDDNPWHYKISWNPRNIVMAGSSGATYRKDDEVHTVPYHELFVNTNPVGIDNIQYAWYANRDSLSYARLYKLEKTSGFIRTTLRHPDFMKGWNYVVKAGLTSETEWDFQSAPTTYSQWLDQHIRTSFGASGFNGFVSEHIDAESQQLITELFTWLGLTGNETLPPSAKSSADVMQFVLENKLQLLPGDKDMIVMLHEISFAIGSQSHHVRSSLVVKGTDSRHTAMAKTVGLPLGIAARLILNGIITKRGLHIPVDAEIYEPVLSELATYGIAFNEQRS